MHPSRGRTGTLYVEEINELPLKMQVKFLRVLQEKEITPIGASTRKVDVRIIAASKHNLEEDVTIGKLRMDLFFRLNVFPLEIPALRERDNDILLLADYFLKKFASENNRPALSFSDDVKRKMLHYSWPGNVLELKHFVERLVLLTKKQIIESVQLPNENVSDLKSVDADNHLKTMEEHEKEYILQVLERCNWKIFGKDGAAEILGLKVSTLNSRIKKLGIDNEIALKKNERKLKNKNM